MDTEKNFLGLDPDFTQKDRSAVVVIPCPYEKTTSYLTGTVLGPAKIIEASEQVEFLDSETMTEPYRNGIYTYPAFDYSKGSVEGWLESTEQVFLEEFEKGHFPLMLGGEHTISIAPIRAAAKVHGAKNISILHFDAHSDMRNTYHDNLYSHASIMRRAHEVVPYSYSVGVRAQCAEEREYLLSHQDKYGILYDHERDKKGFSVKEALRYLPTEKVYLTIDLDYFSPEVMPSVGTPVPGGGGWYDTLAFIRAIYEQRNVIGADIVELKPDHDKRSEFFAAQLAYKLIVYKFLRKP